MARRSKQERRNAVLDEATERVRSSALDWMSSLTFGELASATGIDQAQIARDFGTKEDLAGDLVRHILDPDRYTYYNHHVDTMVASVDEYDSLHSALCDWAANHDEANRSSNTDLRTEMLVWASAQCGSPEWAALASLKKELIAGDTAAANELFSAAEARGATPRGDLDAQDFVVAMTCMVEGLAILAETAPDLVTDDLTARVAVALAAAVVGPDANGPASQLAHVPLRESKVIAHPSSN